MQLTRPFQKKSGWERVTDPGSFDLSKSVRSSVAANPVKSGLIAVGGVAGIGLGSAAVSSLRRRNREPESHS